MRNTTRALWGQILIRPFIKRIRGTMNAAVRRRPSYWNSIFQRRWDNPHIYEWAINFCHDRRDTSAGAEHERPRRRATTLHPRSKCARRTRVYMRSRETTLNAGKTMCAITRRDSTTLSAYTCMQSRAWMMVETNNDGSSFGAYSGTPHTRTICPGRQKCTSNATFREVYDTRHACARRIVHTRSTYTYIPAPEGAGAPRMKTQPGIARRDAFSEIYAVVASILREGNMFHGWQKKRERIE